MRWTSGCSRCCGGSCLEGSQAFELVSDGAQSQEVDGVESLEVRQTWTRLSCWGSEMNDIKKGLQASV